MGYFFSLDYLLLKLQCDGRAAGNRACWKGIVAKSSNTELNDLRIIICFGIFGIFIEKKKTFRL